MDEEKIYQVLRKHKLPLKKREELMVDLLILFNVAGQSEQLVCDRCREHHKEELTDPYCMECKIEIESQAN
jgi:hypothetical protein